MTTLNESVPEGAEKEAKRPTLKDIRNNADQWHLLEIYCKGQKEDEVFDRLDKEESTNDDIEKLSKLRDGFLDLEEDIGKTREQLTDETIARVIERSDDLKVIAKINGPENIRAAIMRNLNETAMAGGNTYKEMSETLTKIVEEKAAAEKETRRAMALAGAHGISKEEYLGALANMPRDPEALKNAVIGNLNPWTHPFQVFGLDAEAIRIKALKLDNRDAVARSKATLEELDNKLGGALRSFVLGNQPVRQDFFSGFGRPKESNDEVIAAGPKAEAIMDSGSVETAVTKPVSVVAASEAAPKSAFVAETASEENNQGREKNEFKVGDFAIWEQKGVLMFKEPKRIVEISEDPSSHKKFAVFEGQKGGVPLEELITPSGEDIAELIKSVREGELVFGDAEFKEAMRISAEKFSKEEILEIRNDWEEYRKEHSSDEGFTFEAGLSNYAEAVSAKKFKKGGGGLFSYVSSIFLPMRIKNIIGNPSPSPKTK